MERKGPTFTVCGYTNQYSHCGNQFVYSSKTFKSNYHMSQRSPFPVIEISIPTFIATIFTKENNQNQPHCPLMNG